MDISQKKKSYKVVTFGCQMNARDSEKLAGVLSMKGYEYTDDENAADIVIFNTCTVRENANMRLYGRVGHLKKSCQDNKNKIVGICGCMMQEPDEVINILKKYPYVKLIFGTVNLDKFPILLDKVIANDYGECIFNDYKYKNCLVDIIDTKKMTTLDSLKYNDVKIKEESRVYSYKCGIDIMYGCDNFCTYCIVPYVRGRERSRSVDNILNEIKNVVDDGVVEVMLLGQNVDSYNGDFNGKNVKFPELLKEVCKIDGLKRVRFMTSHPKDFSCDLIKVINSEPKICRHIHLPVQSGSNKILSLMNRHYTREKYLDIIRMIRSEISDIYISTDVIVGFPGETESDFNETISLIEEANFDAVFTFEYSKRTGTKAATMPNQIETKIVKDRFARLLNVVDKVTVSNRDKYVNRDFEVLIENYETDTKKYVGRMSNNYLVKFDGDNLKIGTFVNVRICKANRVSLEGKQIL